MSVDLGSRIEVAGDDCGWQVWQGNIYAVWDLADGGDDRARFSTDQLPFPADTVGLDGAPVDTHGSELRLRIGRFEGRLLSLDGDDLSGTADNVIESAFDLFAAADSISQTLHDVVAPLVGDAEVLSDECYTLTGNDFLDRLLVLEEIEIVPQLRGYGIGAWAAARSIKTLARDECTLLVAKAAPLRASDFRAGPDPNEDRELTPAETAAWDKAQVKIATHWQNHLGLVPLSSDARILVGTTGSAGVAMQSTLAVWDE